MAITEIPGNGAMLAQTLAMDGFAQSKLVQREILAVGDAFRARNPWIASHTNAIGFAIFLVSCLAIIGTATAYGFDLLPAWATIVIAAFFMSLLHEMEHDLIHSMYFRKNAFLHNLGSAPLICRLASAPRRARQAALHSPRPPC